MPRQNRGIVDIRLSLAFHTAPDVHTLLLLTPTRNRGKLIIEALQQLIRSTGHPAGSREVQLKAVNAWLSGETFTLDFLGGNPLSQPMEEGSEHSEKAISSAVARHPERTDHGPAGDEGLASPTTLTGMHSTKKSDSNADLVGSKTSALRLEVSEGAVLDAVDDAGVAGHPIGAALSRWLS